MNFKLTCLTSSSQFVAVILHYVFSKLGKSSLHDASRSNETCSDLSRQGMLCNYHLLHNTVICRSEQYHTTFHQALLFIEIIVISLFSTWSNTIDNYNCSPLVHGLIKHNVTLVKKVLQPSPFCKHCYFGKQCNTTFTKHCYILFFDRQYTTVFSKHC